MEWEFLLTGQAALAIAAERRPLDKSVGLTIENDKTAVQLLGWFVPDDNEARILFAVDHAVEGLLKAADPAGDLAAVCKRAATEFGVSADWLVPRAVRDRAWDLECYRLAYALRESEDFCYD